MAYAARKRWELNDLRHACMTFFDPKISEPRKAEVFANLGRKTGAVHTIAYQIRAAAEGRIQYPGYTIDQARYCMGMQDTPFAPRPVSSQESSPEAEIQDVVVGSIDEPETAQRLMALVKFELGKQSSELLLEQAATLEGILSVLKEISGSLETQTQLLSEIPVAQYNAAARRA